MRPVLSAIQHRVNSGHVYCLMRKCGFSKPTAKRIAKVVNILCKPFYYGRKQHGRDWNQKRMEWVHRKG